MAWISPTGASGAAWTDRYKAYDELTETYTYDIVPAGTWSEFIYLTRAALDCNKVRFNAAYNVAFLTIDLDVYYGGAWHNTYQGSFLNKQWVEKGLGGTYSVTQARIRIYNGYGSEQWAQLYEFDFWEVEVTAPTVTTQDATGIGFD